jgi:uncharacterized protein
MKLQVKVVPRASKDRVVGWIGDRLKVAVTAAPERGKANAAVVEVLAAHLELAPSRVRIVSGATQAQKTVEIDHPDEALLLSRLPSR